jgi:CubicO group peptidase (beta-lactamase class C family)
VIGAPLLLLALAGDTTRFADLRAYLAAQVDSGAFPGAVAVVGHRGTIVFRAAVGRYGEDDPRPVADSTVYDLASLTKVVGLTTATLLLVADGAVALDEPVQRRVPEFAGDGIARVTVRHLLLHDSGLPAWRPLYQEGEDRAAALALVHATPLEAEPGARYVYSDLGAIVLTEVVERAAGAPIDSLVARRVTGPLAMTRTRYRPPAAWLPFIAPTERDPWRGRIVRGEVHDENAARLGGVSGHAGLFAPADDLVRFAQWLLDAWHGRPVTPAVPAELVRQFTARQDEPPGSSRAFGWDTPSEGNSAGHCLGPRAFGHTGFTGTSIWLDPDLDLFIILLSNRVHPTRENAAIRRVRPAVADLAVRAVAGDAACPMAATR